MTKRKEITVKLGTESFYDILDQKTPEEVIERMRELQSEYEGRKISFDVEPFGYDGGLELVLYEHRLENDEEFEKRTEAEAKEREMKNNQYQKKEAKELAEYERLKKKFEGK